MNARYLLLAALTSLSLTMTSCLEKEAEAEMDKPFAASDVANELNKAWDYNDAKANPVGTMAVGNFVYFDNTQQLETAAPRVYLQEGVTLMRRTVGQDPDTPANNIISYVFGYETREYKGDTPTQSTREQVRYASVPKSTAPVLEQTSVNDSGITSGHLKVQSLDPLISNEISPMAEEEDLTMQLGYEKFIALPYYCVSSTELEKACQEKLGADTCCRTCTNLSAYTEIVDAPALMKARPDCGGLPNCKMTVKRIKFDSIFTVVKKGTTQTQKSIFSIAVSPDLPFLARIVEFCQRGLYDYNSSKILVTNCTNLKDYQAVPTPASIPAQ
jgi:hypothetical protein